MPRAILRDELQRLLEHDVQLVEVLPRQEFQEAHLPGAVSLPLEEMTPGAAGRLRRDRPIVTYCYDMQCDLSPRAAARLESLGHTDVMHYPGGKADWAAFGLPLEGTIETVPTIGQLADQRVPTCRSGDRLGDVRSRVASSLGWDTCFVVNDEGVMLGRLYRSDLLEGDAQVVVDEVLDPGPSTFRPDITAIEMVTRMRELELMTAPVTRSDGRLVGLLRRDDAERAVGSLDDTHLMAPGGERSRRA